MKRFPLITVVCGALAAIAPIQGGVAAPGGTAFTLSPPNLTISTTVDTIAYADVTLTNVSPSPLVVTNPASFSGADAAKFNDTQSGTCWQSYEALGNPIPGKTSCTIRISFLSNTAGNFSAAMTVTRCLAWTTDPTYGFIVCTSLDGSRSIKVTGVASG